MNHNNFIGRPLKDLIDEVNSTHKSAINFYCIEGYGRLIDIVDKEDIIKRNIESISDHMGDYSIWIKLNK